MLGDARKLSDRDLIEAVRANDADASAAFKELHDRHADAAYRLARDVTRDARVTVTPDDVVQEAFTRILAVLRSEHGPREAFRPYLLTAVRRVVYDSCRKDSRVQPVSDMETVPNIELPFRDTAVESEEKKRIVKAFNQLPESDQAVLWHTVIEREKPAAVAPILGITANNVAKRSHRARRELALKYLEGHLRDPAMHEEQCREYVGKLAAWLRGDLGKRARRPVDEHVESCAKCSALVVELQAINSHLITTIGPMVLGAAATGYLPAASSGSGFALLTPRNAAVGGGIAAAAALAMLLIALAAEHQQATPVAAPESHGVHHQAPPLPVVASSPPHPSPVPASSPSPAAPPAQTATKPPVLPLPLPGMTAPEPEPILAVEPDVHVSLLGLANVQAVVHADLWNTGQVDATVGITGGLGR